MGFFLGGGGGGTIFFGNWRLTVWGFFACSGQVSDTLHCTPTPITRCTFCPPIFGMGISKNYVSEKVGTVGERYKGKIMKKWGRTSLLMGSYPEW